ncbi:Protein of unknown function DUF846, eukaryotic [Carpediemonas membranifera]|uniref:Golgi apparatus membrane protein TVP23 homolog n=1 Tax=Carpediemonas membranifera TaxID=201153 RepID=A0A8J6E1D4_9EUKA|nr:Protein of unknown function DUF846, eukaryotic [Carpediemonas membranifera]|eukprot:KAG9390487.1 Protein of unknown function DUF846, eukaryotic [Carpediemonas membranifera]
MELDAPVEVAAAATTGTTAAATEAVAVTGSAMDGVKKVFKFLLALVRKTEHPFVIVFHIIFKLIALLVYVLVDIFETFVPFSSKLVSESNTFIFTFIAVVIFCATDFWVVKNVSGRILVGMRWWSTLDAKGNQIWRFESFRAYGVDKSMNVFEVALFWSVMLVTPMAWAVLFVLSLIRLKLICVLCLVAIVLGVANLIGYVRCQKDARGVVTSFVKRTGRAAGAQAARKYIEHQFRELNEDEV